MSTTRTTKLELQQLLTAANTEREALRVRVAELEALVATRERVAAKPVRPAYVPPAPSAEVLARRAQMAAARELAMRTGRSVRVGA